MRVTGTVRKGYFMGQNSYNQEPNVSSAGQVSSAGGKPSRSSNVRPLQPPPDFAIIDERRPFRAHVDDGSRVNGKLSFEGSVRIDGHIEGDLLAKDAVWVGESAVILAQIKGASVVIEGTVTGDIIATQRIELRATAKVMGNLTAPALLIHEGAIFEGHCCMRQEGRREERSERGRQAEAPSQSFRSIRSVEKVVEPVGATKPAAPALIEGGAPGPLATPPRSPSPPVQGTALAPIEVVSDPVSSPFPAPPSDAMDVPPLLAKDEPRSVPPLPEIPAAIGKRNG